MCAYYNVTTPKIKNTRVAISTFPYFTDLAAATEDLILNAIRKCVTISSTSIEKTLAINAYAEKP